MKHKVFVYGTLKMGGSNHGFLEKAGYLGLAHTVQTFRMYQQFFPVVLECTGEEKGYVVSGELYLVDDDILMRLDALEANGIMYRRQEIPILVEDAEDAAWIYIGIPATWEDRIDKMTETKLDENMHYRY